MFSAPAPRRSRSRSRSRSHSRPRHHHDDHHDHDHHHHHRRRSHSRHSSKSAHSHHSGRSRSRSRSHSRSRSRSRPRSRPHSSSPTGLRHRDLDFLDPALPFHSSVSAARASSVDGIRSHGYGRNRHPRHYGRFDDDRHYMYQTSTYPLPLLRFPARTPDLTFPTAKSFVLQIGNLYAGTPWMQVTDELDGRRLLLGTGSTLPPTGGACLVDEAAGKLLTLRHSHSNDRRGLADVRIVTQNRYGQPLMTAVMPSVSDSRRNIAQNLMAGMQAYGPYGNMPVAWGSAANFAGLPAGNYAGIYPQSRYGLQHGAYAPPHSSFDYLQGRRHYANVGDIDPDCLNTHARDMYEDSGLVAVFFAGDGIYGRSSSRRRRRILFELTRSADGFTESLQGPTGDLATITYSVGGEAGFAAQGGSHRMLVEGGVDVAMIAAALASRIWIWAETSVTH